jgi:hypothetical protein
MEPLGKKEKKGKSGNENRDKEKGKKYVPRPTGDYKI